MFPVVVAGSAGVPPAMSAKREHQVERECKIAFRDVLRAARAPKKS